MDGTDNTDGLLPKAARASYRGGKLASSAHMVIGATSSFESEKRFIRSVPFNGLLTNRLLTALPGDEFTRLLPHLEPVSLLAGQDLYRFGERKDQIYFPETAVISHLYIMEDGSTAEAAMIGREGMIGLSALLDSRPQTFWTRIAVAGSALRIGTGVVRREFANGGATQKILLGYTSTRLAQISQRAVCNGRHHVEERLCAWLLMIYDRAGEDRLPLTHEEIALYLGIRRAGITSVAQKLREKEIISYSRGYIRILDRQGLEAAACECYRTLKRLGI